MARSPHPTPPVARSYDEIVRRTVPEPDGSWRPSPSQERAAQAGARHLDELELALHARVSEALQDAPLDAIEALDVEIHGDHVILHGRVRALHLITDLERRIRMVDGVAAIENRLVVTAR